MKKILFLISTILICYLSYSQNLDLVVKTSGDSIACKIDSLSESQIYFQIKTQGNNKWVQTFDDLDRISDYKYNVINEKMYDFEKGTTVIVGKKNVSRYKNLKNIFYPET
jgi:hypothetical protein